MKTRRTSTKLVVTAVALLLLGTTIAALTQRESPLVTRVRVCVKDNGQLRMVTSSNTACDPSEQLMDWVVGGEVTDIRIGAGLVGGRENGVVDLALAPEIIEGCTSCTGGRIFAGYNDQPGTVPVELFPAPLAKLDLPAGSYAIFAKLTLENFKDEGREGPGKDVVFCRLKAGDDVDEGEITMEEPYFQPGNFYDGADTLGLNMQVVHRFSEPGSVTLTCSEKSDFDPDVAYRDLKIIAIEASHISNVFLGSN